MRTHQPGIHGQQEKLTRRNMNSRKVGRFAVTVITGVLSAISGYAVSKYIDSKKDESSKKDTDIITDHTKKDIYRA